MISENKEILKIKNNNYYILEYNFENIKRRIERNEKLIPNLFLVEQVPLNSTFPFITRLKDDISKNKEIIEYLKEFRINIDKEPEEYYRMAAGDHHLREKRTDSDF